MNTTHKAAGQPKTSGYIPKTILRGAARLSHAISEINNEGDDGFWVILRDGWWNREAGTTAIHERTAKGVASMLRYVEADPRPSSQR